MSIKPLITFVIPAYQAEKHLPISLPSLLNENLFEENILQNFEIIIVNDGSKDKTLEVAKEWQSLWNKRIPNIVKIINKKNGQYGSAINAALKIAQGKYFKVLDADDWFSTQDLIKLNYILLSFRKDVDAIFTNYVYEKVSLNRRYIISLRKFFVPEKRIFIGDAFFGNHLITMHSIIYRRKFLLQIGYSQLENIYYSDSQYALMPLLKCKYIYYAQLDLYHYYIGRSDQSINLKVMVKNRLHQLAVLKFLVKNIDFNNINYKFLRKYTYSTIRQMLLWQIYIIASDLNIKNKRSVFIQLFKYLKYNLSVQHYRKIVKGFFLTMFKITGGFGLEHLVRWGQKIYTKFFKSGNLLDVE